MRTTKRANFPRTIAYKMALNVLEEHLAHKTNKDQILSFRHKYGIPDKSYLTIYPQMVIDNATYPEDWQPNSSTREKAEIIENLANDCALLLRRMGLYQEYSIPSPLLNYVFFNSFQDMSIDASRVPTLSLCLITDEGSDRWKYMDKASKNHIRKHFPVTIRISPHASQTVVLDFIKKTFDEIEKHQSKYGKDQLRLGKARTKSASNIERDTFITEQTGSHKQIMQAFRKKYPKSEPLDHGHIAAIAHKMKKRRGKH